MNVKRRIRKAGERKRMLICDKLEILEQIKAGASERSVAKRYGVHRGAISYMMKVEKQLTDFAKSSSVVAKERSSMRTPKHHHVDEVLFKWMTQAREKGVRITGPLLREKALLINEKLDGPSDFKASKGWLNGFKKRHSVKMTSLQGEKSSVDVEAVEQFARIFSRQVETYKRENIYNADETGINCRDLPKKAPASESEELCAGRKVKKKRVTVLVCANANGTHRLPLLVIGKPAEPCCPEEARLLPFVYKHQESARMDQRIFMDWYEKHFVPLVKERQTADGVTGKVLLLLDHAPAHPNVKDLNVVDEDFSVTYLPPNIDSQIQPIYWGVIERTKRLYRRELLQSLSLNEDRADPYAFARKLNLRDCCGKIASVFASLSASTLRAAWENLLPSETKFPKEERDESDAKEILQTCREIFYQIPAFQDYTSEEFEKWLDQDQNDPGWAMVEIDELIQGLVPFHFVEVRPDYKKIVPSDGSVLEATSIIVDWCETSSLCDAATRGKVMDAMEKVQDLITSRRAEVESKENLMW